MYMYMLLKVKIIFKSLLLLKHTLRLEIIHEISTASYIHVGPIFAILAVNVEQKRRENRQ